MPTLEEIALDIGLSNKENLLSGISLSLMRGIKHFKADGSVLNSVEEIALALEQDGFIEWE